ncbi:MAG: hypothetical protein NTY61_03795 [Candidatus Parcubacteria bacterium]|nr:hypothetical protein [Candidatus Parcubacteria bacterium]
MKNTGKVGNKKGQPKFRTPSTFIANQNLKNNFKGVSFGNQNNFKVRPTKVFNRGK